MNNKPLIPVLAVFGVGLIGGSFSAALRRAGQVGKVLGVGRNRATLEQARALGLIDEVVTPAEAAASADMLLLSTPVGAMRKLLADMAPHLRDEAIVTDGGSTKQDVIAAARDGLGERASQFVPGHPIAGSEQSGPQAARADLYEQRKVILTPLPENSEDDIALVRSAWEACGACVSQMSAAQHDLVLASVSHLPHLLAFAYMGQVAGAPDAELRLRTAGGGFRDFSRIAGSSPEMWRDILLANRDAVLDELQAVQAVQQQIADAMRTDDAESLLALLTRAAEIRKAWDGR